MKKSLLAVLGLSANLFLLSCADDQARQQIADTNQRLNQIQQSVGLLDTKVSNQKLLDLLNQISDLQAQINQLNGALANLQESQSASYINQQLQALDLRLQALESANSAGSRPVKASSSMNAELTAAIKKISSGEINPAIKQLKQIIASPDKTSASTARYFLAVAYLANNQYSEAINEASKFIAANPKHKYVPDAMRVIFIAQSQTGNDNAARATANRLIAKYPHSEAAKKVAKQLE